MIKSCKAETRANLEFLSTFHSGLQQSTQVKQLGTYGPAQARFSRSMLPQSLMKIGQLQLLRQRIQYQLQVSANLNAKQIYCSLEVANK